MSGPRIAAVTIGQAPRPDLVAPLVARAGGSVDIIEIGALDELSREDVAALRPGGAPGRAAYPLTTRLRDGSSVTLDEADLAPLVQQAIDRTEHDGATVVVLLCAGGFAGVTARAELVRPFDAAVAHLRAIGARRVAVVVPYPAQAEPAARKWAAAGFEPATAIGVPESVDLPGPVDAIVLDYVGHARSVVAAIRERTTVPVVDLGEAAADEAMARAGSGAAHAGSIAR